MASDEAVAVYSATELQCSFSDAAVGSELAAIGKSPNIHGTTAPPRQIDVFLQTDVT